MLKNSDLVSLNEKRTIVALKSESERLCVWLRLTHAKWVDWWRIEKSVRLRERERERETAKERGKV